MQLGCPGLSTWTLIPKSGKRASPSKTQAEPKVSWYHQRASRVFTTNQPSPRGTSPFSVCSSRASSTMKPPVSLGHRRRQHDGSVHDNRRVVATREGGCSCGAVRYRLTSEPLFT